jgi:nucleoside-triphosphatase
MGVPENNIMKKNILITGQPGIGKTTLVVRAIRKLEDLGPTGFITEEIREAGVRKGFSLRSLDGRTGTLARVGFRSPFSVGRYGVDVGGFETFLEGMGLFASSSRLVIMDEIGKMECCSKVFKEKVPHLFNDRGRVVVSTIALRGGGILADLKERPDVTLFTLSLGDREALVDTVVAAVRAAVAGLDPA